MALAPVTFHHPRIRPDLTVSVNPDQIVWAYGLNTVSYPTYGGEVVQILSVYWDDITIAGTVATTEEMERIYMWFIRYMQDATQKGPDSRFDQHPVSFLYHERNWTFHIWPKALPGFKYGRDVVAPTWTLTAAVKEPDAQLTEQIKRLASFNAEHKGDFEAFGKSTLDFGATGDLVHNPWAAPDADPLIKGKKDIAQFLADQVNHYADAYHGYVKSYLDDQLQNLPQFQDISKATQGLTGDAPAQKKTKVKKKHGK